MKIPSNKKLEFVNNVLIKIAEVFDKFKMLIFKIFKIYMFAYFMIEYTKPKNFPIKLQPLGKVLGFIVTVFAGMYALTMIYATSIILVVLFNLDFTSLITSIAIIYGYVLVNFGYRGIKFKEIQYEK